MARRAKAKPVKNTETVGGFCFVVMPYGDPFDSYYENIYAPAVSEVGLRPIRADSLFRSSSILGDIWRLTRQAKVLLADMSGRNPNVFYELGLAHAIAQPVVLVASSIDDVPFDLRGLRVIIYDKDDAFWGNKLFDSIVKALIETVEDLRNAVPPTFLEAAPSNRTSQEEPVMLEIRKLQDSIRAIQASLPETKAESTVAEAIVRRSLDERLTEAYRFLRAHTLGHINNAQASEIVFSVTKGLKGEATNKLLQVVELSREAAEKIVDELAYILQPPKDELLRADRGA